jgi:RNA polymerase sigma-32 factor
MCPSIIPITQPRDSAMLAAAEEQALIQAWREQGSESAKARLIAAHQPLVLKAAGRFKGYSLAAEDLVAEGNLGLMRALESFEPERGLRFSTYAQWWVRAAMYDHVLRFSTPMSFSITADRKRIFFKLKALKARLMGPKSGRLAPELMEQAARELQVGQEVLAEMDGLMSHPARSLDAPVGAESELRFGDLLADDAPTAEDRLAESQELAQRKKALAEGWPSLSEREQRILSERRLKETPSRLEDLARIYGISRERVRQIEGEALAKLRRLMIPQPGFAAR